MKTRAPETTPVPTNALADLRVEHNRTWSGSHDCGKNRSISLFRFFTAVQAADHV